MMILSADPAFAVFAMGALPESGNTWLQFVPFAIVLAIFYFIILLPMKKKQQKVQQFLDALKVNDRIVTTGGIYGQVTRLGEQSIQIQIADKVPNRSGQGRDRRLPGPGAGAGAGRRSRESTAVRRSSAAVGARGRPESNMSNLRWKLVTIIVVFVAFAAVGVYPAGRRVARHSFARRC